MRVTTVHLPEAVLEALQRESKETGASQAEIIRQALAIREALRAIAAAQERGVSVDGLVTALLARTGRD